MLQIGYLVCYYERRKILQELTMKINLKLYTVLALLLSNFLLQALTIKEAGLLTRSQRGDALAVERLLEERVNPNVADTAGNTALMFAARGGHNKAVEVLLHQGADPDRVNKTGSTALMIAAGSNKSAAPQVIKSLLKVGADPNIINNKNYTALLLAALDDKFENVEALFDGGVNPNVPDNRLGVTALMRLVIDKQRKMLGTFLENKNLEIDQGDNEGTTALMMASHLGFDDIMNDLIGAGASIRSRDLAGMTPLVLAAEGDQPEAIDILVREGVLIDEQNLEGRTALMLAALNDKIKATKVLLEKGANPFVEDNHGYTAIAFTGSEEIMQLLNDTMNAVSRANLAAHIENQEEARQKIAEEGQEINEEEQCPICLDELDYGAIRQLKCKHRMHKACSDPWIEKNKTCPICRRKASISRWKKFKDAFLCQ
jgi:ankyrin repeat protein